MREKYEATSSKGKGFNLNLLGFDIQQVPRVKNIREDALSKLVALLPTDLKKEIYFKVLKTSNLEKPLVIQQVDEKFY